MSNPDLPNFLEMGEQIIGEYRTKTHVEGHHNLGKAGILILTNRRVLFFTERHALKKLFFSNEPKFDFDMALYLPQVMEVSASGIITKFVQINGRRFYMENVNQHMIANLIKTTAQNAPRDLGIQNPNCVTSMNLPQQQNQTISSPQTNSTQPILSQDSGILPPQKRFCPYCGNQNPSGAKFCTSCGADVSNI